MRAVLITASAQVFVGKGRICGISLIAGDSAAATLYVYNEADSSATSTAMVAGIKIVQATSENYNLDDLYLDAGCYVALAGTGAVGFVYVD